MTTEETVQVALGDAPIMQEIPQLGEAHAPQQASIEAFSSILESVKKELLRLRNKHDNHEPEYFQAVQGLSDTELASFSANDLESVRVTAAAYGLHLFGKVKIPALDNAYIHIRIFGSAKEGTDGSSLEERDHTLHSIHTEETVKENGEKTYRAIFGKDNPLEWFET